MDRFKSTLDRVSKFLESRAFFFIVFGVFIFQSVWIAFSALYPQAFDEGFHFGIINIYKHHWLPFLTQQPANADAYGAVARDPSFLFHYVMSFPLRFIDLFTSSQTAQVIILRLIDIGFFTYGLVLFHKILRRMGVSKGLSNVILAVFILIPIVPQLAGQINYDDMLFPLVALTVLLTFNFIDSIKANKPLYKPLIALITTCMIATITKYEFLPILAATLIFVLVMLVRKYKTRLMSFLKDIWADYKRQKILHKLFLPVIFLIAFSFFCERDVYNFVRYHAVVPDCSTVLSIDQCKAYGTWDYNYNDHKAVLSGKAVANESPIVYTYHWFYWMWLRSFFAVNGSASNFTNYNPEPLPAIAGIIVSILSLGAFIKWGKKIIKSNPYVLFILFVCGLYLISLFIKGYATYKYTDIEENMNGRYLLPILILLAAPAGLALHQAFKKKFISKMLITLVILVFFVEGGGLITFISRSDDTWYFDNSAVKKVNDTARKITNKVVVSNKRHSNDANLIRALK